jgi:hypothetical protein
MELEKIKINKLIFPEYNPRKKLKQGDKEYQKIKKSIEEFGYIDPIIINKDNTIIGGNQRATVLKDLKYKEIDCIRIDINKDKEKALNIALNKISGEWDMSKLSSLLDEIKFYNEDNFILTGFENEEFEKIAEEFESNFSGINSSNNNNYNNDDDNNDGEEIERYTKKIKAPNYVPKMENPPEVKDLYDISKTNELIKKINKLNLDKDISLFLKNSAYRFTKFNFEYIAEFYSHAEPAIQQIFEDLALVIIDFEKAIENGFTTFNKSILKELEEEEKHYEE